MALLKSLGCLAFFLLLWTSAPFKDQCIRYFNRVEEYLLKHKKVILFSTLALYIAINFFLQLHHEIDGDEGQAWLIARDTNSLKQMYSLMGYEGTPALWHTLLFPVAHSGVNFTSIYVINQVFVIAAIIIWLFWAPFPLLVRILLPFTPIFLTEYSVHARSYALSMFLLFAGLTFYKNHYHKWQLWAAVFFLLANTNIHSTILCCGFAFLLFLNWAFKKNKIEGKALMIVAAGILLAIVQVLPPADLRTNLSEFKVVGQLKYITNRIVTGNETLSVLVYFIFLIQVFRTIKNKFQLYSLLSLQIVFFSFFLFKYFGDMRHHFFLLISILMILWISDHKKNKQVTQLFLLSIFLLMFSTAIQLALLEWKYNGNSRKQMAEYIGETTRDQPRSFVAVYPDEMTTSISPYLPKTLFYFPQADRWGTYSIWNQKRDAGNFKPEVVQNIAALPKAHPGYKQYFYLSRKQLPVDSLNFYNIEKIIQTTDPYLATISHPWMTYYLYRLQP